MTIGAHQLDMNDPLRTFRGEFHIPRNKGGEYVTYLCGHSLGLQPRAAHSDIQEVLDDWQQLGVEGHFSAKRPWVSYHEQLSGTLAELAGTHSSEVIAMNSLTVNLHLLLASFYRPTAARHGVLIEAQAFPSDRYAVASQIRWHGYDPTEALLEARPREGIDSVTTEDLCELIEREGQRLAIVVLPGVQYLTGRRFDIRQLTHVAHRQGCVIGFDLAHAIGNVPLALHDWDADFAVWCGYKYLNGGPGAIGGAFVHQRYAMAFDLPRLAGWWGHEKATRFAMPDAFVPLSGVEGWQISNPPILSMAPLISSLDIFHRAGLSRIHDKSRALTGFLGEQLAAQLGEKVRLLTPADSDARGSQLSLVIEAARKPIENVREQLAARDVICDWREPNVLRVAPIALYNSYQDVSTFVEALREVLS
jgi:kynureninase